MTTIWTPEIHTAETTADMDIPTLRTSYWLHMQDRETFRKHSFSSLNPQQKEARKAAIKTGQALHARASELGITL